MVMAESDQYCVHIMGDVITVALECFAYCNTEIEAHIWYQSADIVMEDFEMQLTS